MLNKSEPRLNRLAFLGYYLDTQVDGLTHQRMKLVDALHRRADMDVSGIGAAHGSSPSRPAASAGSSHPAKNAATPSPRIASEDDHPNSAAGNMLDRMNETPEARAERLAQIKEAIDNGDYDTDEKLEAALERMFEIHGFDLDD